MSFLTPDEYTNKVFNMDALELMARLPDASVDAVITDFPYNTTANAWESAIALSDKLWSEIWRVIKSSAPVVTTASQPFTSLLVTRQLAKFRHEWVWEKTRPTGYLNANIAPMKAHENILVFSKTELAFYPQMTRGKPYRATRGAVGGHVRDKTVGGYETINEGWRYPKSVLHVDSVNGSHPSQKPLELYEYLILTYTKPDALIFDPFAGSGTTGVAAQHLGRLFILGDTDAGYCEVARKRLAMPYMVDMFSRLVDAPEATRNET